MLTPSQTCRIQIKCLHGALQHNHRRGKASIQLAGTGASLDLRCNNCFCRLIVRFIHCTSEIGGSSTPATVQHQSKASHLAKHRTAESSDKRRSLFRLICGIPKDRRTYPGQDIHAIVYSIRHCTPHGGILSHLHPTPFLLETRDTCSVGRRFVEYVSGDPIPTNPVWSVRPQDVPRPFVL